MFFFTCVASLLAGQSGLQMTLRALCNEGHEMSYSHCNPLWLLTRPQVRECCSVVCLFNPVFFFLFSVAIAHCRDLTFSNLQIWLQKKPHRHLFQAMTLKMRRRGGVLLLALALLREAFVAPEGSGMGELP